MADSESVKGDNESPTKVQEVQGKAGVEGEAVKPETPRGTPTSPVPGEGGWWGSWITAAKSKSAEVLVMMKKDLDELSTAVKSEASHVITSTSSAIGKTFKLEDNETATSAMKKSFSTFLDQVNTVLNPSPDDDDTEAIMIIDGDSVTLTNFQRDLLALQKLDATYLIAPEGPALASMAAWLEATSRPSQSTLEKHLKSSPILREKVEHLVPHAVSYDDFWERYLFRKALLEDKLAQTNRISADICSDTIVNSVCSNVEEKYTPTPENSPSHSSVSSGDSARSNYGSSKSHSLDFEPSLSKDLEKIGEYIDGVIWDNDFANNVDLTEEQQTKLLQEYEEEIAANERNRNLFPESPSTTPTPPESNSPKTSKPDKGSPQKKPVQKTRLDKSKGGSETIVKTAQQNLNARKNVKKAQAGKKNMNEVTSNMKEDHFIADKVVAKPKIKSLSEEMSEKNDHKLSDSASNNSDESWEKDFEKIDDLHISAK